MINFLDEIIEPISESTSNSGSIITIIIALFATIGAAISGVFVAKKNNKGDK